MDYPIIDIKTVGTPGKGRLSFFEAASDVPFEIKRVYYIYETPEGVQRGGHAHRGLRQVLICLNGAIEVALDDGENRGSVTLDDPSKGLIVEPMVWHDMVWRKDGSTLLVGASGRYDEADYIRDYSEFSREAHS